MKKLTRTTSLFWYCRLCDGKQNARVGFDSKGNVTVDAWGNGWGDTTTHGVLTLNPRLARLLSKRINQALDETKKRTKVQP